MLLLMYQLFAINLIMYLGSVEGTICYDCVGGPATNCGYILSRDMIVDCQTQCYEAYIEYQNGSLPLVQRRCWDTVLNPDPRSYCDWFQNSQTRIDTRATLISCRMCNTDRCNGDKDLVKIIDSPITCVISQ